MKQNRIIGLLLIAVSALTLSYCSTGGVDAFGIFATFMGFIGAFSNVNLKMRQSRKLISLLLIALLFAIYYRSGHQGQSYSDPASVREQWMMIARYFIFISIFYLFVNRKEYLSPTIIVFLSISVLISPRVMEEMDSQAVIYSMLYVVATALFCNSGQLLSVSRFSGLRLKYGLFFSILAISVVLGYYGGTQLSSYNDDIANYLMRIHPAPHLFTGRGGSGRGDSEVAIEDITRLGSVTMMRGAKSRTMVVRVFSDFNPEYLRSQVYETWDSGSWQAELEGEGDSVSLYPLDSGYPSWPYESRENDNIFRLEFYPDSIGVDSDGYNFYDIWPVPAYEMVYLPTDTRYVQITSQQLAIYKSHVVDYVTDHTQGANYQAAVPHRPGRWRLGIEELSRYKQLPDGWLDRSIESLRDSIMSRYKTTSEKINALKWYFLGNYGYSLRPEFPEGEQELVKYFLLNKVDSYCEYFATGTVLLLRSAGIPARYVVGYYVTERDTITDCWVARQRDAHAWAEAWDEAEGRWVVVESTPGSGMPEVAGEISLLSNYIDYFKFKMQEIRVALGVRGLTGLRVWLSDGLYNFVQWLVTTVPGFIVLAFFGVLLLMRSGRRISAYRNRASLPAYIKMLNHQLAAMDRRMSRMGLRRGSDETVRQFAYRIETSVDFKKAEKKKEIVSWYLDYERRRYCCQSVRVDGK